MKNVSFLTVKAVKEKTARYEVENQVNQPKDAYKYLQTVVQPEEAAEEYMWLLTLDIKNKITGLFTVSHGSLNASIVHPREIFKRALLQNAASIIIAHNHPSGDPAPSKEDINITLRIKEAGKIIGIELLDHLIMGDGNYVSLKERGTI